MTLSIITINYNNRDGLKKTIDSVLAQTWTDYEWIVIDGGSTDGSRELIEQYQEHFAYWCSEPDKGVYNAMNKGIAQAKGEYMNFMNSGDTFYEAETLQKVFIMDRIADVLYGDRLKVYTDHVELQTYPLAMEFYCIAYGMICHQALIIKSSWLKEKRYDESLRICADWKHLLEMAIRGATFKHVGVTICRFDMEGKSSTDNKQFQEEWDNVFEGIPETIRKSMGHLKSFAGNRHTVRARLLLEKGGFISFITKVFLAFFDKLFLNTNFKKYPYCD